MNIDRGTANLDILATWLINRINLHTKYSIEGEIKRALRTCITCNAFDNDNETCNKANNQRPPAKVIAYGCPQYNDFDDEIPF